MKGRKSEIRMLKGEKGIKERETTVALIKFGTSIFFPEDRIDKAIFANFVTQIAELMSSGISVMIVSSGAIWLGKNEMKGASNTLSKKELAAIGPTRLDELMGRRF